MGNGVITDPVLFFIYSHLNHCCYETVIGDYTMVCKDPASTDPGSSNTEFLIVN